MEAPFHPDVRPLVTILLAGLPLKVVCAWCDDVVREGVLPISHGCCPTCAAGLLADLEVAS